MPHRFALATCVLMLLAFAPGCEIGVEPPRHQGTAESSATPPAQSAGHVARGHLQFVEGYQQGVAESTRQAKPMLVFFTARWCEYCHQMAAEAFTHPQVVNLSNQFVCVLVDADAEPAVCQQFQITGYPTLQFLSPRGVPLERVVGKRPGHQVMMAMQSALQHVARRVEAPDAIYR